MERLIDIHSHRDHSLATGRAIFNASLQEETFVSDGYFSVGIHPWHIDSGCLNFQKQQLLVKSALNNCLAIGECGLDKYAEASMELQQEVFAFHIELSEALQKPLIIHCVKAVDELLMFRKKIAPSQPWIWHGYRGNPQQALQLINQGFYLSFGEKYNSQSLFLTPSERLFLETDESDIDMEELVARAAKVRQETVGQLQEIIQRNVRKVFFRRNSCNFK